MASAVDTRFTEVVVALGLEVNEFIDMFPKNLRGLSPKWEIDLGTTFLSKAPYRMTPTEMKS